MDINNLLRRVGFPGLLGLAFCLLPQTSQAGSATWKSNPVSGDWYTPENWTPAMVPNDPSATATFLTSEISAISFPPASTTELNRILFPAGASAFSITIVPESTLTLSGAGVENDSTSTQFMFIDGATPAQGTIKPAADVGSAPLDDPVGSLTFSGSASAGHLCIYSNRGRIDFLDSSTAESGSFNSYGSDNSEESGSVISFSDSSKAANASFSANSGSNGGSGTAIYFNDDSTGDSCFVSVSGNGNLDISAHNPPGITISTLSGDGQVFLGANNLTVGSVFRSSFQGVLQDGGVNGGSGGSLTKVGRNTFTLTGASTYTGGTVIEAGTLLAQNGTGSATGIGSVQVNAGKLAGNGTIGGAVTIGTGNQRGAFLSPGLGGVARGGLTIQSSLTFAARSAYQITFNSATALAVKASANGVTIKQGAYLVGHDLGNSTLPAGTTFTLIDNTAATPISGTFANLPDGGTITVGSNTFQASYEGGDGNDLTLTVLQ